MKHVIEFFKTLLFVFLYTLEAIIYRFIQKPKKKINGQVVLITGAGSGIGRIMAHRFARLGCVVVVWDVNEAANEETAAQIKESGHKCHAYTCDLSSKSAIYDAAALVKKEVGDVDILVNNAGIVSGKKFLQCTDTQIENTMKVNIMAHFWTVKSFLPAMMAKNRGHIVSIASAAGLVGVAGLVDYCTSKFAAVGFNETLREELMAEKKFGVKTTAVCPYYINTGMFHGVKVKFPKLLSMMEPDYVVDQIMDGVLTDTEVLILPKIVEGTISVKYLLPTKAQRVIGEFFEVNKDMNYFIGRKKIASMD